VLPKEHRRDLVNALRYYGLPGIDAIEKDHWRDVVLAGPPYSAEQKEGVLIYCWTDVISERNLLRAMQPFLPHDLDRCLYRARYAAAATLAMRTGVPIDTETWARLLGNREAIQHEIVKDCPIYEGTTFKQDRFEAWVEKCGLLSRWPHTETGLLSTEDDVFDDFSYHPAVSQLRKIRSVVEQLRKPSFDVCRGRNWYAILPFKAETSRNSTIGCIAQAPVWLRGLIQPAPGRALISLDYEQQEFAIGGVLSGDSAILKAYASGDPYTPFGTAAGLIPPGGTKKSHPAERAIAKTCMLALQYGSGPARVMRKAGVSLNRAQDFWNAHRRLFRRLWEWSDTQVQRAKWTRSIETQYGWRLAVGPNTKALTLRNYKLQGAAAEILRLASIFLMERSISVACPIHDSLLIECAEEDLEDVAQEAIRHMIRAGEYVLGGFRLRVESQSLRYPDRLHDPRGQNTWDRVLNIASRIDSTTCHVRDLTQVGRSVATPYP
jgi:hypothetical protein